MSDDQIEQAARAYCVAMGLDPDELVGHGDDAGNGTLGWYQSPRWKRAAIEVRRMDALLTAMGVVRGESVQPTVLPLAALVHWGGPTRDQYNLGRCPRKADDEPESGEILAITCRACQEAIDATLRALP